ncbi:MAG: hypothetical protein KDA97_14050 [Acidimicrobiales bacterium]|nr:hypothetical protein [Acidimicrobiales bacterium]
MIARRPVRPLARSAGPVLALALLVAAAGCGSSSDGDAPPADPEAIAALDERLDELDAAVSAWADAATLDEAVAAATEARDLVTGTDEEPGILTDRQGEPGLADPLAGCDQVERDVLGGSWDDPTERWQILDDAIAEWTPANNPFPGLPSHPQRVIGWATLTIDADSLEEAHEYSGHAQLHVDVSSDALATC